MSDEKEKAEDLIIAAVKNAKDKGVKIIRPVVFDWPGPLGERKERVLPYACNATGAVLILLGKEQEFKDHFPLKWLDDIYEHLGVTAYWWSRFCMGWDCAKEITIITVDDKKKEKVTKDKVSKMANKMAQQLIDE
jgi:hypothetical protein